MDQDTSQQVTASGDAGGRVAAGAAGVLSRRSLAPLAILAVVAFVLWFRVLSNSFVWHDVPYVAANLALRDAPVIDYFTDATSSVNQGWPGVDPVFRPLRSLSYRLDFMIGGALNPRTGHGHSLLIHVVNAVLVLVLARLVGLGALGSLFVALLFLVHPVQTEAVCWLVCRDALLSTTLVLGGLVYALWRFRQGWRLVDSVLLGVIYLAACLASPQAFFFPVFVACFVIAVRAERESGGGQQESASRGSRLAAIWSAVAVFSAVAVLYAYWSVAVAAGSGQEPNTVLGGEKVKLLAVSRAVGLFLAPATLQPDYSDLGTGQRGEGVLLALGAVLVVLVLFLIWRCWRVRPSLSAALSVCLLAIVSAWSVEGGSFGERMLYMPMVGFALALGLVAQRLAALRMQAVGVAVGVILVLASVRTMLRIPDWKNDEQLLFPAFEYSPDNKAIMRQLMRQYFASRDYDRAIIVAQGLLDATHAGPGFGVMRAEPLRVKGISMVSTGAVEQGRALLNEAIAADPYYGRALHDLGVMEIQALRPAAAVPLLQKASALMPHDGTVNEHLGLALEGVGRVREAEAAYRRAAEREWGIPSAARRLAVMLVRQNRLPDAAAACRRSLRRFPGDPELEVWLEKATGTSNIGR